MEYRGQCTYSRDNRLATATVGALSYAYTYNGREQLAIRQQTTGTVSTTHFVHDIFGNVLAETSGVAAGTTREYIWLPETEIAPTREAMSQVDRPLAVVNGVGTTGVAVWNVSVDHLNRPVLMTNNLKVAMWTAVWQPWGGAHSITGTATLDTRFPGQWYQSETGLHYNWHRSYDPTVGRYTQPDPLGFVDGPSVYGYAKGRPQSLVDPDGRNALVALCFTPAGMLPCAVISGSAIIAGAIITCMSTPKGKTKVWTGYGPEYVDEDFCTNNPSGASSGPTNPNCDCMDAFGDAVNRCQQRYKLDPWQNGKCVERAQKKRDKCLAAKG
jgi:RHS repeat-associated protein